MAVTTDPATETQKSLAAALIALAGLLFGAVLGGLPTVLSLSDETGDRIGFWLSTAILALLVISIIFGGRGYAYGPKRTGFGSRFNLQATSGLFAILLTVGLGVIIYTYPASQQEAALAERVAALESTIEELNEKVDELAGSSGEVASQTEDIGEAISALQTRVEELAERIGRLEGEPDDQ